MAATSERLSSTVMSSRDSVKKKENTFVEMYLLNLFSNFTVQIMINSTASS